MKRFKPTPEVIVKGLLSFLFGAVVGFLSFRLVTRFSPNFVSAKTEEPETFEKTSFPLKLEKTTEEETLSNNSDIVDAYLRAYPNIEINEEEE